MEASPIDERTRDVAEGEGRARERAGEKAHCAEVPLDDRCRVLTKQSRRRSLRHALPSHGKPICAFNRLPRRPRLVVDDRQTVRPRKDCAVRCGSKRLRSYRTLFSAVMRRRRGEERKGAVQWVPPSLLMQQLNMVFRKVEGGRKGRDDEDDCDTGLISLAKCVLSDPPAAAGQSYISARLGLALLGEEGEPRNGPF